MTRPDEPCGTGEPVRKVSVRQMLVQNAGKICNKAKEIEELTHQLIQGLIGKDEFGENRKEKDGEPMPDDLMNLVTDANDTTMREQDVTIERLNYLINEFCDFEKKGSMS